MRSSDRPATPARKYWADRHVCCLISPDQLQVISTYCGVLGEDTRYDRSKGRTEKSLMLVSSSVSLKHEDSLRNRTIPLHLLSLWVYHQCQETIISRTSKAYLNISPIVPAPTANTALLPIPCNILVPMISPTFLLTATPIEPAIAIGILARYTGLRP